MLHRSSGRSEIGVTGPTGMADRALVIDASVAIALIRDEPVAAEARRILTAGRSPAPAPMVVPFLFWQEVVNALAHRHRVSGEIIVEALYELESLGIETRDVTRAELLLIVDAVERHGLTAYDATYLALAVSADASLVTTDRSLAEAAGERAVLLGTPSRVSERQARYEAASRTASARSSWAAWPGAAAYLRELRERATFS